MPIYVGNQTDESDLVQMQFFISEEAMNLGLRTLFESGALVKGHRIASTHIKTFIPNFEEVFGKHSDVFMLVEALTAPSITITQGVSKVGCEGSFLLMNPFNEEFEAVRTKFTVESELEFELLENFQLIGNIKKAKIDVTEFQTYF